MEYRMSKGFPSSSSKSMIMFAVSLQHIVLRVRFYFLQTIKLTLIINLTTGIGLSLQHIGGFSDCFLSL